MREQSKEPDHDQRRPPSAPESRRAEIDDADDPMPETKASTQPKPTLADELREETGIDLTDASELDADNVPADEEFDRVMQAPD